MITWATDSRNRITTRRYHTNPAEAAPVCTPPALFHWSWSCKWLLSLAEIMLNLYNHVLPSICIEEDAKRSDQPWYKERINISSMHVQKAHIRKTGLGTQTVKRMTAVAYTEFSSNIRCLNFLRDFALRWWQEIRERQEVRKWKNNQNRHLIEYLS